MARSPRNVATTSPGPLGLTFAPTPEHSGPELNDAIAFTYRQLASAANNFRSESMIGYGGFGNVFKGQLQSTGQIVAIKGLRPENVPGAIQGQSEFLVEILMLSVLRHPNIVNLIGYCSDGDQRLIVYEFLPLASLDYHLHNVGSQMQPLDWNTRMKIAAGVAKALNYLHTEAEPLVIFRDLKSSNVLLGEDYHPVLSDFGLAKFGQDNGDSVIHTRAMGTFGTCAPEHFASGALTTKSDVYSFGVLLLELVTGQKSLDNNRGDGMCRLVDWVCAKVRDNGFVSIADPVLNGQVSMSRLRQVLKMAFMCTFEKPTKRPSMSDVVYCLDYLISAPSEQNQGIGETSNPEANSARAIAEDILWGRQGRLQQRSSI